MTQRERVAIIGAGHVGATTGQYGIADMFVRLPCMLGAAGVKRILTPDLTQGKQAELVALADVLAKALAALDAAL